MGKMLDLTRNRRVYLPVKLDEIGEIHVATPEKHMYDELMAFAPQLSDIEAGDDAGNMRAATDGLYSICAMLLSNNREGREITKEQAIALLDVELAVAFLNGYAEFIASIGAGREKN